MRWLLVMIKRCEPISPSLFTFYSQFVAIRCD